MMIHQAAKAEAKRIFRRWVGTAVPADVLSELHLETQGLIDRIYDKGSDPVEWEYKIFIPGVLADVNALGIILVAQSQDGWQFICEAQDRLVFRRPKS